MAVIRSHGLGKQAMFLFLITTCRVAFDRLKSLVRRFHTDNDLLHSYDNTIRQQLSQKVIEIMDTTEQTNFPHHPVLTPRKATTKLRIVYDAFSKAKRDLNSLNECLY